MSLLLIILCTITLCWSSHYLIRKVLYWRRLPPGPWGLPIFGSMIHLLRTNLFEEFEKYQKKYGKVFSLAVGNFDVIVINDYKLIQEALKRDEFCGRPHFEIWTNRNMGNTNRGILVCDANQTWMEQRRFALRNLRDFGLGKDSMEGLILNELEVLIGALKKDLGKPVSLVSIFNAYVLNSLWYILAGSRFELDDPVFNSIIAAFTVTFKNALVLGPGFFYPWPAKRNIIRRGLWEKQTNNAKKTLGLIQNEIQKHVDAYIPNEMKDFIDAYLHETQNCSPESSFSGEEGRRNLEIVLLDLFLAGTETTSTTLLWAIYYICQNPNVQRKIHEEIDSKIGTSSLPMKSDKSKLVYIEAVLNETHRQCSLIPFSVFHRMQQDMQLGGYNFPKDVLIYPNLYEAHHNKKYWGDPENFRPERFLDAETQSKLIKHEPFMPFSTGKRVCLGEVLAKDTLFLFFTGLLQQFQFELDLDSNSMERSGMNNGMPKSATIIISPVEFNVVIKSRLVK